MRGTRHHVLGYVLMNSLRQAFTVLLVYLFCKSFRIRISSVQRSVLMQLIYRISILIRVGGPQTGNTDQSL